MDSFWTTQDAARFLGLSASTLTKLRLTGGGPVFRKFGRSVRYAEREVREWADARVRKSTSDCGLEPRPALETRNA